MFVDLVDNIELGGRAMFTVQAYDANNGIPTLDPRMMPACTTDMTRLRVVVPDIAQSLVRGSELLNGVLTLDKDTGMGQLHHLRACQRDGWQHRPPYSSAPATWKSPTPSPSAIQTQCRRPTRWRGMMFTADVHRDRGPLPQGSGMVDVSWTRSEELSPSALVMLLDDQGDGSVVGISHFITLGSSTQFSGVDSR